MSISNTAVLTDVQIDTMNVGLSAFFIPVGERDDLAAYYGVGVRTVLRWFRRGGRCVPRAAIGLRPYQMFDDGNISGWGDGSVRENPLQNMRLRVFMAAALGVDGGFEREPIYSGPEKTLTEKNGSLSACVDRMNSVYTGNAVYFLWKAWTRFVINPLDGDPDGKTWEIEIHYNVIVDGDQSDGEEIEGPEYEGG